MERCNEFNIEYNRSNQCLLQYGHQGNCLFDSPYFASSENDRFAQDINWNLESQPILHSNAPALSSQHLGVRRPVLGDQIIVYQSMYPSAPVMQFGFVTGTSSEDWTIISATLFTNDSLRPMRVLSYVPYGEKRKNGNAYWLYKE